MTLPAPLMIGICTRLSYNNGFPLLLFFEFEIKQTLQPVDMGYSGLDIPSWAPHTPRDGWHPKKGGLNILLLVPYIPRARYCSPGSPNNQVWIIQSWLLIHPGLNIPVMVPFTSRARYSHPGSLYTHGRILQYLAPYTPRVRYSSLGSTYN